MLQRAGGPVKGRGILQREQPEKRKAKNRNRGTAGLDMANGDLGRHQAKKKK